MDEEKLPRKILEWCPAGRIKKGKPRNPWMRRSQLKWEKGGIKNLEWVEREGWRRKITLKIKPRKMWKHQGSAQLKININNIINFKIDFNDLCNLSINYNLNYTILPFVRRSVMTPLSRSSVIIHNQIGQCT